MFEQSSAPHESLYQSPLLYNWRLDEASVVTRVTGIMRAALMMGALIPLNINTMSIYSFSGKLCKQGNYIHPGYQMEDIIALIRKLWIWISSLIMMVVMIMNILILGGWGCWGRG